MKSLNGMQLEQLVSDTNTLNHLTEWALVRLKINKLFLHQSYIFDMYTYKQGLALNNHKGWYAIKHNTTNNIFELQEFYLKTWFQVSLLKGTPFRAYFLNEIRLKNWLVDQP